MPEWSLYYDRFLIADGEAERRVGETFDYFVVEFWTTKRLKKYRQKRKTATAIAEHQYRVCAEVIHVSKDSCVVDFGLLTVGRADSIPRGCKEGDYVLGEVRLNLPLCVRDVPQSIIETMRYKWLVNKIHADITPNISHGDNPKVFSRDESKIRYEEVLSTDSVEASGYVLHCTELGKSC